MRCFCNRPSETGASSFLKGSRQFLAPVDEIAHSQNELFLAYPEINSSLTKLSQNRSRDAVLPKWNFFVFFSFVSNNPPYVGGMSQRG
jgi:hypothetical protein